MPPTTITATITARGAQSTVPDDDRAVDARIYADGAEIGAVTLLPAVDGRPVYETWGTGIDHWASDAVIVYLDGLDPDDRPTIIGEIEAAVTTEAEATTEITYSYVRDLVRRSGTWTGDQSVAIREAVCRLEASPDGAAWTYHADEIREDVTVSGADMALLGAALLDGITMSEAYSIWCAETG